MRKLALGLGMAFLYLCCSSAYAEVSSTDSMNSRIKSLQERLKQFQHRTYADEEDKLVGEEEAVDLILDRADESILPVAEIPITDDMAEKIVEDFENRTDVAVTVLFHDTDTEGGFYGANKDFAMIEPPKVIIEDSPEDRQLFYANLRQRVLQATRSSKLEVDDINRQLVAYVK